MLVVVLQREGLGADPDLPRPVVRPIETTFLAEPGQDLRGLHRVAPLVVARPGVRGERRRGRGESERVVVVRGGRVIVRGRW